jgi:hypothetical protein
MKKLLLLSLIVFLSAKLFAQQTEAEPIKQTRNTLFNAMRKGDSTLLRSAFSKNMLLQSISNDKNGNCIFATNF